GWTRRSTRSTGSTRRRIPPLIAAERSRRPEHENRAEAHYARRSTGPSFGAGRPPSARAFWGRSTTRGYTGRGAADLPTRTQAYPSRGVSGLRVDCRQRGGQGPTRPHHGHGLVPVRPVVAADVDRRALHLVQLPHDRVLVPGQRLGQRGELFC